jgi:hypothetical protein
VQHARIWTCADWQTTQCFTTPTSATP